MRLRAPPKLVFRVMVPMIRAASLRGFASLVEDLGGDPDRLLERFALSRELTASDDELIPIDAHDSMLDTAAVELHCPDFGLRLAVIQDLSILGPLAPAIQESSTVAEALKCASRFLFVHSPALEVDVEPDPYGRRGVVALSYCKDLRESAYSRQGIELGLGLFFRIAELLVGGRIGLRSVEIPHRPLSPVRRYTDFFGSDVKFGRPVAAICVDRRVLDERFTDATRPSGRSHSASWPTTSPTPVAQCPRTFARSLPRHSLRNPLCPMLRVCSRCILERCSGDSPRKAPPSTRCSTTSAAISHTGSSRRTTCGSPT